MVNTLQTTTPGNQTAHAQQILIFKTTICTESDKRFIGRVMKDCHIIDWSVDLHDVDCVLRIVTADYSIDQIIWLICSNGFLCEELR
ncbi:MAG: hypothetical protein P0Y53_17640 [Candidatus Pseudobacter hemicellulosilyticus]|uniref:Uncharacterized protein n=1 Tax=Candidatus Pseudobacter hemicellulosilyticus TaxID=3121375 RepID=A0AAJ6BFI4_9BACT|nr:MAG: hypothetical protein P0Y53_17640 [Pseudobacter sp.]